MQTSTWSLSRSMVLGSKDSSGVAMYLRKVVENNLVCGVLLALAHVGRSNDRLGRHVEHVLGPKCVDGLVNGLAVRARRPDILTGVDMTSAQCVEVNVR